MQQSRRAKPCVVCHITRHQTPAGEDTAAATENSRELFHPTLCLPPSVPAPPLCYRAGTGRPTDRRRDARRLPAAALRAEISACDSEMEPSVRCANQNWITVKGGPRRHPQKARIGRRFHAGLLSWITAATHATAMVLLQVLMYPYIVKLAGQLDKPVGPPALCALGDTLGVSLRGRTGTEGPVPAAGTFVAKQLASQLQPAGMDRQGQPGGRDHIWSGTVPYSGPRCPRAHITQSSHLGQQRCPLTPPGRPDPPALPPPHRYGQP
jgi:hypothetical protein